MRFVYLFSWILLLLLVLETRNVVTSFLLCRRQHESPATPQHYFAVIDRSLRASSSLDIELQTRIPFEQQLLQYLQQNDTTSVITVQGIVRSKRSLGKQLVFCDLHVIEEEENNNNSNSNTSNSNKADLCQALLKRDSYLLHNNHTHNTTATNIGHSYFEGYRRCLLPGTIVRVTGTAAPTHNPGKVVLLLQSIHLVLLPRQIQHVTTILQQCCQGNLACCEVAQASGMQESKLQQRLQAIQSAAQRNDPLGMESSTTLLQQLARDIHDQLPSVDEKTNPLVRLNDTPTTMTNPFALPVAPDAWKQLSLPSQPITTTDTHSYTGWVQNRQRFQDNITVFTLVVMEDSGMEEEQRWTCLLHPAILQQDASVYRNLLAVGAQVQVEGYPCPLVSNHPTTTQDAFVVQTIRLLQSSDRPETIRYLLDIMADPEQPQGIIDLEDAAQALRITYHDATSLSQSLDATERQWKANQLSAQLQQQRGSRPQQNNLDPSLLQPLEKYRPVAQKYPVQSVGRHEFVNNNNIPLLRSGVAGSRWMSTKKPQLEWMCQQIRSVLASHPEYGTRQFTILDVGGGQGFLANGLGQAMMEHIEQIHVVDICARAVHNGATRAQRWGTPVTFEVADASRALDHVPTADIVVALHACGHLSDVALAHAVQRQAGFVIVPCCFHSNPHLTIPSSEESVHDWLGIPLHDWSALKTLAEVQGNIGLATRAMELICAVRADAVQSKWKTRNDDKRKLNVTIRQFPMEYSTRNTVLVGSFY